MSEMLTRSELDQRIADVEENLRVLIELAAAVSGPADEELANDRIQEQQVLLDRLILRRASLEFDED
ncbi:hypothetical protein JNB88_22700 [Rhizobium cauense]|uniref:hypothetical protein n=1 Tax=Rhizobium cauense TaxID=1166683 RepID=UPI001C6E1739|nr:hypothetical protein [Rhizobium cauense]MBW9116451.1 hypothetical protein [Rhizobium cauense]